MGCNCNQTTGFQATLRKALAYEQQSGNKAAIFIKNDGVYFSDLSNIDKVKGICCYYLTDNTEVKIKKNVVSKLSGAPDAPTQRNTDNAKSKTTNKG